MSMEQLNEIDELKDALIGRDIDVDRLTKQRDEARQQLAEALAERDEAEARSANLRHELYLANEKTAAALAAIKVKDGALRFYKSALTADDVAGVALSATTDIDGLILCHAEPAAIVYRDYGGNGAILQTELVDDEPLYRAWEPK